MTSLLDRIIGLRDRGDCPGRFTGGLSCSTRKLVNDNVTSEKPRQFNDGIEYMIVNGNVVIDHDKTNETFECEVFRRKFNV